MKPFSGYLLVAVLGVSLPGCSVAKPVTEPTVIARDDVPKLTFSVVAEYPHDSKAFTQGLFWNNGHLYESTGLLGYSSLRKVDLKTGKVLLHHRLPDDVFGEGTAVMDARVVQLTWKKQRAYVYDHKDLTVMGNLPYQGEGWGLTSDSKSWISSDGSDKLTWRDSKTFQPQRSVQVVWNGQPVKNLNELEWINGNIWANIWYTNWIIQIDPQHGEVLSYIDITNLVPTHTGSEDVANGIAYDTATKRIFITGKRWPKLYEIELK